MTEQQPAAAAMAAHQVAPVPAVTADLHQAAPAQPPTPPRSAPGLTQSNKSAQRAFDVPAALDPAPQPIEAVDALARAPEPLSAHAWIAQWAEETGRSVVAATAETGDVSHTVVYVAPDGIVLNKGRSGAVYPVPIGVVLQVGDKMAVDRNGELCPPRQRAVGKNEPGR